MSPAYVTADSFRPQRKDTDVSAALQLTPDNPREGAAADWVVAWRIIYQEPMCGVVPTRAEVRLACWYLFDRGYGVREIMARTRLDKATVTAVQDLRKRSHWSTTKGSEDRRKRARRARAARPYWRHLWMLGVVA